MSTQVSPLAASSTAIEGLWRIESKAVTDERGTVRELFRTSGYAELDIRVPERWSQINLTWTRRGAIRGLHGEAMTKLVGVAHGEAFAAYLDARRDSPTRGIVVTTTLTVGEQMLVPPGVCNGFQSISEGGCQYLYCFDAEWVPGMAGVAVTPLDPDLHIAWPIEPDPPNLALISAKDRSAPRFAGLAS
ncbi:MAG: dTDP-4-dehydrorhamnose 3,5-epimerase family protein [Jatrophihabitantaceae bacterium]